MDNYKIYVGGEFKTTSKILKVQNPFTGKIFANTYLAGENEVEEAIFKAKKAQNTMKEMPSYKKYEILMQIASAIKENKQHLALTLTRESGKPIRYANGEIDRAIQVFIVAAEEAKRLPKEYISLDWTPAGERKEGIVKHFPIGIIAGISPFNFPMNLAVHKIAPAIASGCPIIIKPASATPLSVLELAKIIDNTDLPKGAFSALPMDRVFGNQIITDERIKLLSFTGSPEVGWQMKANAGKKKVILELGGNAGVIITNSVEIDKIIQKCITGAFAYSGQVCIHAQRFYAHNSVFEEFVSKMCIATKKLVYGNPENEATDISVMIDENNAIRIENWVEEAVKAGAKVLTGGKRQGSYFEPTIITNSNRSMNICSKENFGPVITIEPYSTFSEAVDAINDSKFGLQAGVFTNNTNEINYAFNNLEVGGVVINDVPTFRVDHMPYGGIKDSGMGREGVKYAIVDMMEPKILINSY